MTARKPLIDGMTEAAMNAQARRLWPDRSSLEERAAPLSEEAVLETTGVALSEKSRAQLRLKAGLLESLVGARAQEVERWGRFTGFVTLTKGQCEELFDAHHLSDDWEETATPGTRIGPILGDVPVVLVATVEESTPWKLGWRPQTREQEPLLVQKLAVYTEVSCCLLTDSTGKNHCTHTPREYPPLSWRWRARERWHNLRERVAQWIAGDRWPADDETAAAVPGTPVGGSAATFEEYFGQGMARALKEFEG
ncbi:hypothetical protein [Actinosynnema sp. NPDC023587]|uniref:hypothetical protein n=1 Tax=Actinosynnema sp. NPDC023587 TaxID=3154695 RepID=UPI0033DCEF6A